MGKRRVAKPELVDAVDLDAIQDNQPHSPQQDFDSWCTRQDEQWDPVREQWR